MAKGVKKYTYFRNTADSMTPDRGDKAHLTRIASLNLFAGDLPSICKKKATSVNDMPTVKILKKPKYALIGNRLNKLTYNYTLDYHVTNKNANF